jgi:hypothetical protein
MLIKGEDGVLFCQKLLSAVLDMVLGGVISSEGLKKKATTFGHDMTRDTPKRARSRSEYHRTWYPGTGRVHDFSEHRMVQVKQKIYYTWTVGHVDDVYYTAVYLYTFDLCPFVLFV